MKKAIFLVASIIAIWIIFKMMGIGFSTSLNTKHKESNGWIGDYELAMSGNNPENIIGLSLPEAASDVQTYGHMEFKNDLKYKSNWLIASIPKKDFDDLIHRVAAVYNPHLLKVLPNAIDCHADEFRSHWKVSNSINKDTFWQEAKDEETYRVFKYENGKMYIKKIVEYNVGTDDEGVLIYKKALKK